MNRHRTPRPAPGGGRAAQRIRTTSDPDDAAPQVRTARLVLYGRPTDRVTLEMLAERTGLHPRRIRDYVEYGLLEPSEQVGERVYFEAAALVRLRRIERLRRDLGVNLTGIGIILDMRERLLRLQRELERREL